MSMNPLYDPLTSTDGEIENPFTIQDASNDVLIMVEDLKAYVNSEVLKLRSPVFSVMLGGDFLEGKQRRIRLPGKEARHIIGMLRFFFPDKALPLTEDYDFYAMLLLCDEYQIDWLKEEIHDFLLKRFVRMCELCCDDYRHSNADDMVIYLWYLAENFKLETLKRLCCKHSFTSSFVYLTNIPTFTLLMSDSKLFLYKVCLKNNFGRRFENNNLNDSQCSYIDTLLGQKSKKFCVYK